MLGDSYRNFVHSYRAPGVDFMPLDNAALGLCGEVAETVEEMRMGANPLTEMGDVLFYAAAMAVSVGVTDADIATYLVPAPLNGIDNAVSRLYLHAGMLAELTKKTLYGTKAPPSVQHFAEHLAGVLNALESLAGWYKADLEGLKAVNVAKLKARWPSGYGK